MNKILSKLNQTITITPGTSKPVFVVKKISQRLRWIISKYYDPVLEMKLGSRIINAPMSHNLPNLLAENVFYDAALPRLAKAVKDKDGHLTMIDIGANIGDSVNLVDQIVHGQFLCIEPTNTFFHILRENTADIQDVTLEQVAVSDIDGETLHVIDEHRGSARLREAETATPIITMDTLVERNPTFKRTNLVKIDTDGFDYKVIRGAEKLMSTAKPLVYFELSPDHMIHVGNEDIMSIFDVLEARGYTNLLFYDHLGYPISPVNVRERRTIEGILGYVHRRPFFWLDVLAMHETQSEFFSDLVDREYDAIPKFVRPYFSH